MNFTSRSAILVISFVVTVLLIVGCSSDGNHILAPASPPQEQAEFVEPALENPYPVLTEEQIESGLIPGYQVLKVDPRAYGHSEGNLDDRTSCFIRRTQGGTVSHRNNGVQIGPWQLWEDRTVTVETPNPGYAIVDYYPHPYRFNGCVRIWLNLAWVQLPPGRRWDELAFFYVDSNGQLIRYWGQLDLNAMTYSAWPDHFSRYIISIPAQ